MRLHDFRSDTVTLPTPAMMDAIARARLGDAARGDDPTVHELEAMVCTLTGKADALLLPSGAMANLAALIAHECRGGEVIVEASSHVYNGEGGGLSVVAGAIARPVAGQRGVLAPADVEAAIRGGHMAPGDMAPGDMAPGDMAPGDMELGDVGRASTRLICLENTHNAAGGVVVPLDVLQATFRLAQHHGIPVHLDGARLFNAAAFLDVPIERLCRHADSVWFSLCKGLGGPIGAVLAGERAFIARARRAARLLGGGMRQAGLIAAPALVALRDPYPGHRRDHRLAHQLATGLAAVDGSLVDPACVQTNIVNCELEPNAKRADTVAAALQEQRVLVNARGTRIRFVTHAQVDESDVAAAIDAMADALHRTGSGTFQRGNPCTNAAHRTR